MKIHREKLAWAAGFFEGEGCFHRNKGSSKNSSPDYGTLQIAQVNPEPLDKFRAVFPFLYPARPQGKNQIWALRSGKFEHVQAVVAALWPWLSTKRRQQAKLALTGVK